MQVKRYEAANMRDALHMIKKEMGTDAIVISTKRLPGMNGLIEVVAARDIGISDDVESDNNAVLSQKEDVLASVRIEIEELKSLVKGVRREKLFKEVAELKDGMNVFFDVLGLRDRIKSDSFSKIYHHLVSRGVSRARACKLLDEMKRQHPIHEISDYETGLKIAESLLRVSLKKFNGYKEKRVKFFLGPTGVGKTTTLAKLAARYTLERKLSVGLISMDTYRIAALEQLKVYARIMGLPMEVAAERESFRKSLERFSDKDVVLVDTPGKSRADGQYLEKIKDIVSADGDVETNLLLSLTSSKESMADVLCRFGNIGCDRIIFTKLDECDACGVLYDVIEQTGKPVSYVTMGQDVPRDIEEMNPTRLAELIMWH